jgi:hypothetical protein
MARHANPLAGAVSETRGGRTPPQVGDDPIGEFLEDEAQAALHRRDARPTCRCGSAGSPSR